MPILMYKHKYPIETKEAYTFWSSKHKCNRMKSIIAFSTDLENANDNLRRHGYKKSWRIRALNNFGMYVNKPDMSTVPFSEASTSWWECMPFDPNPLPPPSRCVWVDEHVWIDTERWVECEV